VAARGVAVRRHEGIEEHDRADRIAHLLGDARDDHAAIGVADQHDVVEVLPFDHVDDVGNVGREIDLAADQVRALAEPGHRGREHLVPFLRRQHQPPCQAPCTSTKVFPPVCACAVV